MNFSIVSLADHPEYIDVCAAWGLGYWGIFNPKKQGRFSDAYKAFATDLKADDIPLTLLMIDEEKDRPVAMGSLWTKDSDHWTDLTPWIASLFVHENYRGQGLADRLINALENKAKALNQDVLYLTAVKNVAPLYTKLGYEMIDQRDAPERHGKIEYLFKKALV